MNRSAFTMIELLVVIAVIAILSVVVILAINPAELLRQSRDSNRLADLATITTAFGVYSAEGGTAYGSPSVVYVSIPDPAATSTAGDQCQGLGLISLPASYTYHCAASSSFRSPDGTGWVPVNFSALSGGSPIGHLPIDPVNSSFSRLYDTYTTNGSQYELTTILESQKYKLGGNNDAISGDGGTLASVYEKGTGLGLEPLDYGDISLAGYWTLDEGTGTVAYDYSGSNATGSWNATPNIQWVSGKTGSFALQFTGGSTVITYSDTNLPTTQITVTAWVNPNSIGSAGWPSLMNNNIGADGTWQFFLFSNTARFKVMVGGANHQSACAGFTPGSWHFFVGTYDGNTVYCYTDTVRGAASATGNQALYTAGNITTTAGTSTFIMGDVRIYNRALSATEIAALYNGGR